MLGLITLVKITGGNWNDYINWYVRLTRECMRVLKPTGNLFMMNYPKQNAHLRVNYLDENAFGVQEYVWVYNTNVGHSKRRFTKAHRSILHATKPKNNIIFTRITWRCPIKIQRIKE